MVSNYAVAWCSILALIPSLSVVLSFIISPITRQSSVVHLYQEEGAPYPRSNTNRNFSSSLVGSQLSSSLVSSTTTATQANRNSTTVNNDEADVVGGGTLGDIMSVKEDISSNTPTSLNNNTNNISHNIHDGLVTKEGGELNRRFKGCDFTNMERIALTANGNLQRIFSSYYDEPVVVHVDSCTRRDNNSIDSSGSSRDSSSAIMNGLCDTYQLTSTLNNNEDAIWDRVVYIQVHNQTIVKATSIINVHSSSCIQLIEEGSVGLGQLFRYLNKLPTFSLLDAGRIDRRSSRDKIPTENPNDVDDKFDGGMWRIYELQCEEMTCLIHEEFRSDAWEH